MKSKIFGCPKDSPNELKVNQTMGTATCDIKAFLLFWSITDGKHTKHNKTVGSLSRSSVNRKKTNCDYS